MPLVETKVLYRRYASRATGGRVSRNYVSKLANGGIGDPSFGKIYAPAEAMRVPLEAWMGNPKKATSDSPGA